MPRWSQVRKFRGKLYKLVAASSGREPLQGAQKKGGGRLVRLSKSEQQGGFRWGLYREA